MKTRKLFALVLALLMLLSCTTLLAGAANLPTPQNVQVSGGNEKIEIKWDPIDDFNARKDLYYFRVLYSTDKTNWQLAGTSPRDSAMDVVSEPREGAFVPGTTYYFAVQAVSWYEEFGPISAPSAAIKFTSTSGEKRAEWDALLAGFKSRTTEKGTKYDKVNLVKGEKLVWNNGLYTLTVQVASVSTTKATLKVTMKNKIQPYFCCSYVGWDGVGGKTAGASLDARNSTANLTVNFSDLIDGANYLKFCVTTYGSPISQYRDVAPSAEYNEYSNDMLYLNRAHYLYFQKAPAAASLTFRGENLKVTSNAISFGAAFKSSSPVSKGSGTILYYKAADAKKWSKKTFAAGKELKITKLQPNTQYSLRTVNYVKSVSAADGKTVVTSKSGYSNTLKIITGLSAAPEIKSVKVTSKVVTVHHDEQWWYNGVKWIHKDAYDSTQTNFTVTVTLKSVPKGMKALQCAGLGDINAQIRTSKNATFTFTGTRGGNAKGKSISLSFLSYTNKLDNDWFAGSSPSVKKSVTL